MISLPKWIQYVQKPYRYIGGEKGSIQKDWNAASVRICLAFPDTYEIGMSHIGMQILYHIVNREPDYIAERVFTPWPDMEQALYAHDLALFSLENHEPLMNFDAIGFSLAYELTYTNVLTILKTAGIPVLSKDRNDSHPIIIAGGPCAYNPFPVQDIMDVFIIGDGEDAILQFLATIKQSKQNNGSRDQLLETLATMPGVYVPAKHTDGKNLRNIISDLNTAFYPDVPIVPYAALQMRSAIEVSRGCTRGCRFCQAGYIYRPLRQRSAENTVGIATRSLSSTGFDELSFLSLSISDWAPLEFSLQHVHESCAHLPFQASLPSLRVEGISDGMISRLGKGRSGSFTLAPEAATERLRQIINKGNTDADLYQSVESIFKAGWQAIKLYFMIGLPGETPKDIVAIATVAKRCRDIGRKYHRRPDITVSTSTFVPKPHTPFQWEAQLSIDEIKKCQADLKQLIRGPGLSYKWHDAAISYLEGVFSRGDARLSKVIIRAHEYGARFDGWSESFNMSAWQRAFDDYKINTSAYLKKRDTSVQLPWSTLNIGPSNRYLLSEQQNAFNQIHTMDCSVSECTACGLCDFTSVQNITAKTLPIEGRGVDLSPANTENIQMHHYRFQYEKTGDACMLGHLEVTDMIRYGLRASGLPLVYTSGFHPRVKMSMGPALGVGIASLCEFMDIWTMQPIDIDATVQLVSSHLPKGLCVVDGWNLKGYKGSIESSVCRTKYCITNISYINNKKECIDQFLSKDNVIVCRKRPKGNKEINIRSSIASLYCDEVNNVVVGLKAGEVKPRLNELLFGIFNLDEKESSDMYSQIMLTKIASTYTDEFTNIMKTDAL